MFTKRKSQDRGHANHGWLDSYHTFSFADYYDPKHMGFSVLRVINQDVIEGGGGFPTHPHRDMEIITYVTEGALEHKDTLGNSTVIRPGEVQRMSAGTGIRHSEFNHFNDRRTELLQIWILPETEGIAPGYEQKNFSREFQNQEITLVASPQGDQGSVRIHQNAKLYVGKVKPGNPLSLPIDRERKVWFQMVRGSGTLNDVAVSPGDGVAVTNEGQLNFNAKEPVEFLLFDLP